MQKRILGRTGVELSVVGFGGIVVMNAAPEQADRDVAQAIERGINYFDVAPSYGNAEERLGPALEPYRQNAMGGPSWHECSSRLCRSQLTIDSPSTSLRPLIPST